MSRAEPLRTQIAPSRAASAYAYLYYGLARAGPD